MKKVLYILIGLILLIKPSPVKADELIAEGSALMKVADAVKDDRADRVKILTAFLGHYNSPLTEYAEVIVDSANENGIDWRLIPAISGVESTFCKSIPYGSNNCWGWSNGTYRFTDLGEAVKIISSGIKKGYYNKGLTTPETMSRVYCPPSTTWGGNVRFFMNKIDSMAYELAQSPKFYL